MSTNPTPTWTELNFVFADKTEMTFEVRLVESVICDIALDPGTPDFRLKSSFNDLFGVDALPFSKNGFPHEDLWFRYARILAAEKCFKYSPPADTELLRIIIFEYLRIAEYIFCLSTFSLNAGLNDIFTALSEQYKSLRHFLASILAEITPFEIISGLKRFDDLSIGFTERNLKFLQNNYLPLEQNLQRLLRNKLILDRCHAIPPQLPDRSIPLSGGPNLRAFGYISDRRHDFPYSFYNKLPFDHLNTFNNSSLPACECWQRLRVRCEEIFISINLIRQAIKMLIYEKTLKHPSPIPTVISKGHTNGIIESPWGPIACQLNCPGGKEPSEFILTNPMYEIRSFLRQTAIGIDISAFPLLVASLDFRHNPELTSMPETA